MHISSSENHASRSNARKTAIPEKQTELSNRTYKRVLSDLLQIFRRGEIMPGSSSIYRITWQFIITALLLLTCSAAYAGLQNSVAAATIKTYQDNSGWKLLVNGESYFVKGVVWGYTPIGETYAYNLWSKPDDDIKKILD